MRRIAISVVAALLALSALAPVAAADEEPASVPVCIDGATWEAEPGQPLLFRCGWSTFTYGQMVSWLNSVVRSYTVTDAAGNMVLSVGPDEAAAAWGTPERFEGDTGPGGCAGRWGWITTWRILYETGLDAGTYTVTFTETLTKPVNDGLHTCWWDDGTRLVPAPSLYRAGTSISVSTIVVE